MKRTIATAIVAMTLGGFASGSSFAGEATSSDVLSDWDAVPTEELKDESGKNAVFDSSNVTQSNKSNLSGDIKDSGITNIGGKVLTGDIGAATVTDNRGIVMLTQNTGDIVNINEAVNVNVLAK